jgi:hypothetical protein
MSSSRALLKAACFPLGVCVAVVLLCMVRISPYDAETQMAAIEDLAKTKHLESGKILETTSRIIDLADHSELYARSDKQSDPEQVKPRHENKHSVLKTKQKGTDKRKGAGKIDIDGTGKQRKSVLPDIDAHSTVSMKEFILNGLFMLILMT